MKVLEPPKPRRPEISTTYCKKCRAHLLIEEKDLFRGKDDTLRYRCGYCNQANDAAGLKWRLDYLGESK